MFPFERRENEQWAFRSLHSAIEIFGNKNSISICHIEKIWPDLGWAFFLANLAKLMKVIKNI